ncbi:DeoR/GlpR family DNA-binding transcription regulator [Lacticaseibacillus zeae]|uniref:Lactose phosphotransferase system repressor n=1 Tax=Lacticaseibacillus zeae TaxID=57037 RepID=A0A5R8LYH2_LACZE|nr:DeoR/GlpR family DNA-binding transcription regulator [Lacticaseibacillus zeae]TLF42425.1 DeoR/GlpR transcriptional regulator [Lacticaseibacillus zeae]
MMKKQRQSAILALLNSSEDKSLTTTEIAKTMNVASMTIRRDLNEMAKDKLINRVYGGASLVNEKSTKEKTRVQRESKIEIGRVIGSLIHPKTTIFLGAGTTIYAAADFLPKKDDVKYVTNSDLIFRYMVSKDVNVFLTGGFYHKTTNEFVGSIAEQTLSNYIFDVAFISTNGIFDDQVTTSNFDEGNIQKAAMKRSKEMYVVADHTKFGQGDSFSFAQLNEFTGLITDSKISQSDLRRYREITGVLVGKADNNVTNDNN